MKLSKRMSTSCTLAVYDSPLFKARGVRATLEGNNLFIYIYNWKGNMCDMSLEFFTHLIVFLNTDNCVFDE